MNNRTAKLIRRHCAALGASKKQYRRMKQAWSKLNQEVRQLAKRSIKATLLNLVEAKETSQN